MILLSCIDLGTNKNLMQNRTSPTNFHAKKTSWDDFNISLIKENIMLHLSNYFNCTEALTFVNVRKNKNFQNGA